MADDVVRSQDQTALKMRREGVEVCPDWLFARSPDRSKLRAVADHTGFGAHPDSPPSQKSSQPWDVRVKGYPAFGTDHTGDRTRLKPEAVHSKADILVDCDPMSELAATSGRVTDSDLPSGLHGLRSSRGEGRFDDICHIEHHAGQLIERLGQGPDRGAGWPAGVR